MFLSLENFHLVFTNGYDVNWVSGFGLVCIGIYQHYAHQECLTKQPIPLLKALLSQARMAIRFTSIIFV